MQVPFLSFREENMLEDKTKSGKISRLYSIDLFRIICAATVFLFHSRIHLGVNYRILNNFIGNGHIFMVAFFMMSGFCLFIVYGGGMIQLCS